MSSPLVAWDRLVRYVPVGADTTVRYGQPILENESDAGSIAQLAQSGKLQVKVLEGEDIFSAKPTDKVETVARLLGPIEASAVPIIRCIGLNYKTHSKRKSPRPCSLCDMSAKERHFSEIRRL